jgi:hypothetical protein
MSISTRRRFGLLLTCGSVLAWIVALIFFSHSRVIGSGSSASGSWTASEVEIDLGWRFFLPVVLCGIVGVFCIAWPSRKPPRLPH